MARRRIVTRYSLMRPGGYESGRKGILTPQRFEDSRTFVHGTAQRLQILSYPGCARDSRERGHTVADAPHGCRSVRLVSPSAARSQHPGIGLLAVPPIPLGTR